MKVIFIGPQGSGKGTQAKIIADKQNICHISTGDLLRESGSLKQETDLYMQEGKLVPDELIIKILKQKIQQPECEKGFILDGFPRNLSQAETLDSITNIDKVIEISISDTEAIKRISGRRNCKNCGAIYNIYTSPKPSQENICDKCGGELLQRADDTEEAVKKRLEIYHKETEPILGKYDSIKINGEQPIEKVSEDISENLDK